MAEPGGNQTTTTNVGGGSANQREEWETFPRCAPDHLVREAHEESADQGEGVLDLGVHHRALEKEQDAALHRPFCRL